MKKDNTSNKLSKIPSTFNKDTKNKADSKGMTNSQSIKTQPITTTSKQTPSESTSKNETPRSQAPQSNTQTNATTNLTTSTTITKNDAHHHGEKSTQIRVICRFRPLNAVEQVFEF